MMNISTRHSGSERSSASCPESIYLPQRHTCSESGDSRAWQRFSARRSPERLRLNTNMLSHGSRARRSADLLHGMTRQYRGAIA